MHRVEALVPHPPRRLTMPGNTLTRRSIMRRARSESPLSPCCSLVLAAALCVHGGMANAQSTSWTKAASNDQVIPGDANAPVLEDREYALPELLTIALDINPKTREVEQ